MALFRRGQPPEALSAAMAGVKMGDRVLLVGAGDTRLSAEVATRAGLSGRVAVIARDSAAARERAAAIEAAGGLAEALEGSPVAIDAEPESFDAAIADSALDALTDDERTRAIAECLRVLRPGGRLVWMERQARGGWFGLGAATSDSRGARGANDAREGALTAAGFRGVRTLATAAGRTYVEGVRPANPNPTLNS